MNELAWFLIFIIAVSSMVVIIVLWRSIGGSKMIFRQEELESTGYIQQNSTIQENSTDYVGGIP